MRGVDAPMISEMKALDSETRRLKTSHSDGRAVPVAQLRMLTELLTEALGGKR